MGTTNTWACRNCSSRATVIVHPVGELCPAAHLAVSMPGYGAQDQVGCSCGVAFGRDNTELAARAAEAHHAEVNA